MDPYRETLENWNKVAQAYQDKFMDLDIYNETYDLLCQLIESGANVLELGCGPGNITRYIRLKRPDLNITATDAAREMVRLAKENNPGIDAFLLDCRDIRSLTPVYSAIICGFVLPYLGKQDCENFINDCASKLKRDGLLYLSTIEGDYSRSGIETGSTGLKMKVYYYEEHYTRELLKRAGFDLANVSRITYPFDRRPVPNLVFIARKAFT